MNLSLAAQNQRFRQLARYLTGIVVVSMGATLGIQSGVGASPYDALLVTLTDRFGTPFWATAWILQAVWVIAIWRAGGRIRATALLHSLSFGPIMAVGLRLVPEATGWATSAVYLTGAVLGMALGLWLYLGAAFVAGMVDTLFDTLSRRGNWRDSSLRTVFDIACCAYAWIGGGPVGLGTVVIAFGVGPLLGAISSGLLRPASWRGIGLGARPEPELVDTSEYAILAQGPHG